jgi:hypothetical protein
MVVFACYNCKDAKGDPTRFKIPDPYAAAEFICPKCKAPVIVPDKPCGECICSAQIADENLICCMVSTTDKIMVIPFNMDAAKDGICPYFARVDDTADIEIAEDDYQDLVEELESLDQPKEKDEFDKAFDEI